MSTNISYQQAFSSNPNVLGAYLASMIEDEGAEVAYLRLPFAADVESLPSILSVTVDYANLYYSLTAVIRSSMTSSPAPYRLIKADVDRRLGTVQVTFVSV